MGWQKKKDSNAKVGSCDLCGQVAPLYRAIVEGVDMDICKACEKFGQIKYALKNEPKVKLKPKVVETEVIEILSDDYASIIKKGREKLNLTQAQFAKRLNEKESLMHAVESAKMRPSFELARKLEKFLKVTLIEEHEEKPMAKHATKPDTENYTVGDFIKIRKR